MCDLRHCISSFPIFTSTFVSLHFLYSVCFYLSGNHVFLKLVFISLTFHLFLLLALQLRTMQFSYYWHHPLDIFNKYVYNQDIKIKAKSLTLNVYWEIFNISSWYSQTNIRYSHHIQCLITDISKVIHSNIRLNNIDKYQYNWYSVCVILKCKKNLLHSDR